MQLGKSLLGAILGAAVGIGLLLIVYVTLGHDRIWLSIPFAIVTGLGVRMLVSTTGHASYLRGAVTMLIALAAYILGWWVVAQVAVARANTNAAKAPVHTEESTAPSEVETTATDAPPEPVPAPMAARSDEMAKGRAPAPKAFGSPVDFVCLGIAALVAYQLGRGSESAAVPAEQPSEAVPAGTHPDA
jgi:hypothetical protein